MADDGLCGLINIDRTDAGNPFRNCYKDPRMNVEAFTENCLYDLCALKASEDDVKFAACGTLTGLSAQCRSLGYIVEWRTASDCRKLCACGHFAVFMGGHILHSWFQLTTALEAGNSRTMISHAL